jgi:ABC-type transporter MlaC component
MKTFVTILVAAAMTVLSLGAIAGPDENQRMMTQQIMQSKQKLAAAQAAQGAERQKMMQEHMTMMQKTMGQMQAMKPGADMTPTEQKEWITEHQKLMELMMGQMMDEHHLMMQMNCK